MTVLMHRSSQSGLPLGGTILSLAGSSEATLTVILPLFLLNLGRFIMADGSTCHVEYLVGEARKRNDSPLRLRHSCFPGDYGL